ncbi:MAG: TetR/AcrR family transcriptional regulator [Mycobacteriales bacterium]
MATAEGALTPERILVAAEDTVRRYGPAKATVVDVARALGVSHGSVYRHFASKAALRDAVAERWLHRVAVPLIEITKGDEPAPERLRRWLEGLIGYKQRLAREDPELFATYVTLASEARTVVKAHVDELCGQLERIVADGVAGGEFAVADPAATAGAIFAATARYHHPAHAAEWADGETTVGFAAVWALILDGIRPRTART